MRIHELGHVVLYVTSLERSADFYGNVLGFREVAWAPGMAAFSSGRTHHELLLIEIGGTPKRKAGVEPGLYHIGFKIGNSKAELKRALKELQQVKTPITGTADHTATYSMYTEDPDGNEIELYVDVSDEWKKDPKAILKPTRRLVL